MKRRINKLTASQGNKVNQYSNLNNTINNKYLNLKECYNLITFSNLTKEKKEKLSNMLGQVT